MTSSSRPQKIGITMVASICGTSIGTGTLLVTNMLATCWCNTLWTLAIIAIRSFSQLSSITDSISTPIEVAVDLWKLGWPHGKRPSLGKMLDSMGWDGVGDSMGRKICDTFNHLVHGDPLASEWNTITLDTGKVGYASGRILDRPDLCDTLSGIAYSHMLVLMTMMAATFPDLDETVSAVSDAVKIVTG